MSDKPQSPDHFGRFESDHPAEPERAMTPYEKWDSRPKIAAADPLEGIPRLRSVPNLGDFAAQLERASRDTEPSDLLGDDDNTPAQRPFEIRVERELKELRADVDAIKRSSREAAQHAVDTYELVKAIDSRQRSREVERALSAVAWAVNFVLVCWALLRTYR